MNSPDPLLTGAQAAQRLGLVPSTWRSYVARGYAPAPDDPGDLSASANRRNPRWRASSVDRFKANRLHQGTRTDLQTAAKDATR